MLFSMKDTSQTAEKVEKPIKTIGDAINDLVARYGHSTLGLYILEAALVKAVCGDECFASVQIGGKHLSDYRNVKAIRIKEASIVESVCPKVAVHVLLP